MQSDSKLVSAVVHGQMQAFESLVERYERPVRALATNVVKDRHLAGDVAQEAFFKAYQGLATLRRPEAFGPWLMQITHRCALDAARKRARQTAMTQQAGGTPASDNGRLTEDKQWLLAAVMKLPAGERQVVALRYFGCQTVKAVADITGRSIGTVTKQLSRAHRRLRSILKEY